jgi:surface polysaccharide O-acyltransferase-like enzyme
MSSILLLQDESARNKRRNFEGFDFLRAIFSIAIVALKTNLFNIVEILGASTLAYALKAIIGYLAVPVFLQISLFLFYGKSERAEFSYFMQNRLPRLISLYLFWVVSLTLFDILFRGQLESIKLTTSSFRKLVEFIVSGGNSPFFFFFSLIFVTAVTEMLILMFGRLRIPSTKKKIISYCLLLASCILVFSFSVVEPIANYTGIQLTNLNSLINITKWDYNPLNFLPYIFTAAITAKEYSEGKLKEITVSLKLRLYGLFALFLIFSALEWTLLSGLLHYARISLVLGSWLLLYLTLLSKCEVPKSIKFISACSLGIYGFHVFFTHALILGDISFFSSLFQMFPSLEILTIFLVTLMGSIVLTLVFKRTKFLRSFV